MNFNLYNSLILAGVLQGLLFAAIIFATHRKRSKATLFLALWILGFSLDNLQFYLEDVGFISYDELFAYYFLPFSMLSGVFFLFYGRYVLDARHAPKRSANLLYLPFALSCLILLGGRMLFDADAFRAFYEEYEELLEYASIAFDLAAVVYLFVRWKRLAQAERRSLRWFRNMLAGLFAVCLVWIAVTIEDYYFGLDHWYVVYVLMSVIIYAMGHFSLYRIGMSSQGARMRMIPSAKNAGSDHGEKEKSTLIQAFEKSLISGKRFLDPDLTLEKIAAELAVSKGHLSRSINAELHTGFPEFINQLRVEQAKYYLTHPDFSNYTLVAIGLEAGFASKTTFNSAFKKITGVTPSAYKKKSSRIAS